MDKSSINKSEKTKPDACNYFVDIDIMRSPMALLNAENKIHSRLLVKDKN
jgi:hypothetical protein